MGGWAMHSHMKEIKKKQFKPSKKLELHLISKRNLRIETWACFFKARQKNIQLDNLNNDSCLT